MGIVIDGSNSAGTINLGTNGTVTNLAVGGIPDGTVDTDSLAANAATGAKIAMGSDAAGDVLYYNGTDYIRLAKGTDGQVLTLASGVPTWAAAGGVKEADLWRITSGKTIATSETVVDANWERSDDSGFGKLGTGMTESSGVFTFPSTGIWHVRFQYMMEESSTGTYNTCHIQTTIDNGSNWVKVTAGVTSTASSGSSYANGVAETLFDVTDVSNCKTRFSGEGNFETVWDGSTGQNRTFGLFTRLGDT